MCKPYHLTSNSLLRKSVAVVFILIASGTLFGCGTANMVSFHRLKSADKFCNTQAHYLRKLDVPPHRIAVDPKTGVETWAWDTDVQREKRMDKTQGDPYWYEGYYVVCTYEVRFDKDGNKLDSRWVGSGCFNSRGELYNEGGFLYDE